MQWIDPEQLASVSDLQLLARLVVDGMMMGIHRSPTLGSSIEFAQYRPYVQGDDLRFVDWSLYARTDRLHVKQFLDETNLRCMILLDASASMNYTSKKVTKFEYARMLAACLATLLFKQKDAVGLFVFQQNKKIVIPARNSPNHFRRLMVELSNVQPEGPLDVEKVFHDVGDMVKPGSMVVLLSDLLYPQNVIGDYLKLLHARRQDILIMQISDEAEMTFPFERTVTLVDAESEQEQYMIPSLVREQYLENRNKHFEAIREDCMPSDIDYEEFITSKPLDHALRFFLQRRNRFMAMSPRRNRVASGGY